MVWLQTKAVAALAQDKPAVPNLTNQAKPLVVRADKLGNQGKRLVARAAKLGSLAKQAKEAAVGNLVKEKAQVVAATQKNRAAEDLPTSNKKASDDSWLTLHSLDFLVVEPTRPVAVPSRT